MSEKADTVPGLGYKDKEKALETLENLEGRDPDYQKLAIKGLIGRAKRTLTLTKDKEKLENINSAVKIFENWLKDYEFKNLGKENKPYLPLASIQTLLPLKEKYGIESELSDEFLKAYKEKAKGDYKNLRTISSGENQPTWDIVRNKELQKIWKEFEESRPDLWNSDELPTKEHLRLILWAYSPEANKIKKNVASYEEKLGGLKISSDNEKESDEDQSEEEKEKKASKQSNKRKSEGKSSSSRGSKAGGSGDESPKKKNRKD